MFNSIETKTESSEISNPDVMFMHIDDLQRITYMYMAVQNLRGPGMIKLDIGSINFHLCTQRKLD